MKPRNQGVDQLYREGRTYPDGKHTAQEPAPKPVRTIPPPAASQQRPQMPEDQHSPGYSNDVAHSWLTGLNEDGMKPSFDRGNSWRQGRNPKLRKD